MKPELSKIVKAESSVDFSTWANYLLQEIYYTPEHLRATLIQDHLLKAVRRGFVDAAHNDWWAAQEAAPQKPL